MEVKESVDIYSIVVSDGYGVEKRFADHPGKGDPTGRRRVFQPAGSVFPSLNI